MSLKLRIPIFVLFFEMVYFRSYWSHLDISPTICPHPMAPLRHRGGLRTPNKTFLFMVIVITALLLDVAHKNL